MRFYHDPSTKKLYAGHSLAKPLRTLLRMTSQMQVAAYAGKTTPQLAQRREQENSVERAKGRKKRESLRNLVKDLTRNDAPMLLYQSVVNNRNKHPAGKTGPRLLDRTCYCGFWCSFSIFSFQLHPPLLVGYQFFTRLPTFLQLDKTVYVP